MEFGYPVAGFVVGTIVGLTGVGGGSLMTPLLVLLFGVHPVTAVGTDLLYAAITKSAGTLVHGRKGSVDWGITGRLALGSIPAAVITLYALSHFDLRSAAVSHTVSAALGVALLLTAGALIFRRQLQRFAASSQGHEPQWRRHHLPAATVAVGALLGVLVSISSVGAGALGVAGLFFLYPALPALRIVGADIAHAVPLTLVAGIGHWMLGNIDWLLLGSLLIGSVPGIVLGSHVAAKIPEKILRPALAAMLVAVGGKLLAS